MAYLIHLFNGEAVRHYELFDEVTIGRSKDNTLQIDDTTISSRHAVIERKDEGFEISDLGSTNGLKVNGETVATHRLKPGDVILLGTHDFEFVEQVSEDLSKTVRIKKSWIPGIFYTER